MKIDKNSFYLESLGCAKNLVDSQAMGHLLKSQGLHAIDDHRRAEFIIVNTCGFIEDARVESGNLLSEMAAAKQTGQYLIAAGCLTQRYQASFPMDIAGIDAMLGTRRWMDISLVINKLQQNSPQTPYLHFPLSERMGTDEKGAPAIAIQGGSSYLKIADGCRRPCAYCAIPLIKGTLVSRPKDAILHDLKLLQDHNIKEVNLIAQDVTDYGHDRGEKDGLLALLQRMLIETPHIPWIRLLYAFPGFNVNGLINIIKSSPQILPYIDLPLQHADPKILKSMNRPSNIEHTADALLHMRHEIPNLSLRTTFIVGYPGETDVAFNRLLDFVKLIRFDHLGAFTYSLESGTPAENLGDPIPQSVKLERFERLMATQAKISAEINRSLIGQTMDMLVEGVDPEQKILVGRTKRDAPEIDGLIIARGNGAVGEILPVRIKSATEHDLFGNVESGLPQ